ncbi:fad dependent [Moniliophthora roreri]|uniref:FAD dependent oxidoreductase domain-containing protein n=1 Tax=Moniliophthora roreri TaxID=221103 RepID=A0A0W0F2A8_MONRR|nr:fad dependent [Moniliophthora roreri]
MGGIISQLRLSIEAFITISRAYRKLSGRIQQSPGIPVQGPSIPYWTIPPSPIAHHGAGSKVPEYADVVIIGSGITGTSVARELLNQCEQVPLQVVMLEARDACSGATARNGGHLTPILYAGYSDLKKKHGKQAAQKIIYFRLAHLTELLQVAKDENLLEDSQARKVQTFNVFFDNHFYEDHKEDLKAYLEDFPEMRSKWETIDGEQAIEGLQFSERVKGVISTEAGAIHPYRFVTGILSRLIQLTSFRLFTHTPCTSIQTVQSPGSILYVLETPNGTIRTPHVVHATNAWSSHLLEPMRGKIVPARGNMTAQRPGQGLGNATLSTDPDSASWLGSRSFIFYPGNTENRFDYLTQQPPSSSSSSSFPSPSGEFMFGGGFVQGGFAERAFFEEVGNTDDRDWNLGVSAYLSGALSVYFGNWWGQEGTSSSTIKLPGPIAEGRVIKCWSGIIGISADGMPWVGRVPSQVSGRPSVTEGLRPHRKQHGENEFKPYSDVASMKMNQVHENLISEPSTILASPGEWIAAGFTGEGMVHAWLSGKALALMMLGKDSKPSKPYYRWSNPFRAAEKIREHELSGWFPDNFRVSVKRWKKANIADL